MSSDIDNNTNNNIDVIDSTNSANADIKELKVIFRKLITNGTKKAINYMKTMLIDSDSDTRDMLIEHIKNTFEISKIPDFYKFYISSCTDGILYPELHLENNISSIDIDIRDLIRLSYEYIGGELSNVDRLVKEYTEDEYDKIYDSILFDIKYDLYHNIRSWDDIKKFLNFTLIRTEIESSWDYLFFRKIIVIKLISLHRENLQDKSNEKVEEVINEILDKNIIKICPDIKDDIRYVLYLLNGPINGPNINIENTTSMDVGDEDY